MQARQPTPAKPAGLFVTPKAPSAEKKTKYEIIEVPDLDLSMEEWTMTARKLKPGQDIRIVVTISNLGSRTVNDKLAIRVMKDNFFQASATPVSKPIPATGEIKVEVLLKVKGGITNLHTLPPQKELLLVKDMGPGQLAKIASISIVIPIQPFIRYLKEEFAPIRLQMWGLFGTGKSSFINSLATLYNEDARFPNKKLTPAFSRPSTETVTTEMKQYEFDNVQIRDAWGWEEAKQEVYNDLLFQLMLSGRLGKNFAMGDAKTLTVLKLPKGEEVPPTDLVLFFVTVGSVQSEAYLNKMDHFIKETQKLGIPFLVLLTQIDTVDPSLKQDPYCINPTIQDQVAQVCRKIEMDESFVVPVVNYTRETERTWAMDRAAFVTLYRAFQAREEHGMGQ